jgi:hypothetical protein
MLSDRWSHLPQDKQNSKASSWNLLYFLKHRCIRLSGDQEGSRKGTQGEEGAPFKEGGRHVETTGML